jgi:hypothetical protein
MILIGLGVTVFSADYVAKSWIGANGTARGFKSEIPKGRIAVVLDILRVEADSTVIYPLVGFVTTWYSFWSCAHPI